MSELKVHRFITTDELFSEANAGALYYDKSEADKTIAKLQDDCAYWKAMAQKNAADNAVMVKQRAEAFKKKEQPQVQTVPTAKAPGFPIRKAVNRTITERQEGKI